MGHDTIFQRNNLCGREVTVLGIITWLIVGVIAGWLAGAVFNIQAAISGFDLRTIIVAFLGAVIVIYVARLIKS